MTPDQKANDLIEKYENVTVHLPYIDLDEDQAIGEGFMTHLSAIQCAMVAVDEMIIEFKKSDSLFATNFLANYWQEVKTELNKKLK